MSDRIRFHLDEHVAHAIAKGLRQRGIDVSTTAEAEAAGLDDSAQLAFATKEGRVMVTQDDDFLRLHAEGVEHTGIVYWHQGHRSLGDVIRGLVLIYEVLEPSDMHQKIEFL